MLRHTVYKSTPSRIPPTVHSTFNSSASVCIYNGFLLSSTPPSRRVHRRQLCQRPVSAQRPVRMQVQRADGGERGEQGGPLLGRVSVVSFPFLAMFPNQSLRLFFCKSRKFNGRPWCYVNRPNSCTDEKPSKRSLVSVHHASHFNAFSLFFSWQFLYASFEACKTQTDVPVLK